MDERLLLGQAVSGDLESFGQLYDQYFPRVYDFAWRTLGDEAEAADATREVFEQAVRRLPHGTGGSSFRAWLFALAFRIVLARAERPGRTPPAMAPAHEEAFGSFEVPDPARLADPAVAAGDHELAALVWEAAASLTPRDRAVLDLHLRQGLDSAELAGILATNKRDAANLVRRMNAAAADALASYVIARRGGIACDRLQEVLAPFQLPPYTDAARHAVDTHVAGCPACGSARAALPPVLDVFGGFAAVQAPAELKGDVWSGIAAGWTLRPVTIADLEPPPPAPGAAPPGLLGAAGAGGGGSGGGFAPPPGGGWDRRQALWFGGAAAAMILFAFVVGFIAMNALGSGGNPTPAAATTATAVPTDTPNPAASITPGVAILTPTPNLTPSATSTPPPTSTPAPATATPTQAPRTATATGTAVGTLTPPPGGTPTASATGGASPTHTAQATPTP